MIHTSKEYVVVMRLHGKVGVEDLRRVIGEFTGEIYQTPPLRSNVRRSLRRRFIYSIDLLEYDGTHALLRVHAEAGTYIRKLCWDMGLVLGVGAHMRELRRVRTGPFSEERGLVTMQDLWYAIHRLREEGKDDLLRKYILPGEYSICHLPKVAIRDTAVESIAHGADLYAPGVSMVQDTIGKGDTVAVLTLKGELVALGRATQSYKEMLEARRGVVVDVVRVVMRQGIYPRSWKTS